MRYVIAITALFVTSCSTVRVTSDHELPIAESVLRSLYGENASAEMPNKVGASLCINGKNLPSEVLARFRDLRPTPLPCSAAQYSDKQGELVRRGTTEPVIRFNVREIKVISPDYATAVGNYYEAPLSSAEYSFELSRVGGKWIVQKRKMNWIS